MKALTKQELINKVEQLEKRCDEQMMNNRGYNKYKFIEELTQEIKDAIESEEINDRDDIDQRISESVENECIYYKNCFEIAMELNATDFTAYDMGGDIHDISGLAFAALYEYAFEEIDYNELEKLIEEKQAA